MTTDNSDHLTHLDSYCERAGDPALWAEPLNAVTNLFFILFAYFALRDMQKLRELPFAKTWDIWLLIIALFAIGIGSGLWHTFAVEWAVLADVIPIGIFINLFIVSALIRVVGLKWFYALGVWAIYTWAGAAIQSAFPPDYLHGSVFYLPTYLMLIGFVAVLAIRNSPYTAMFTAITFMWTFSLLMRTVDLEVCSSFAHGTHFLWHTLNAVVLYGLLRVLTLPLLNRNTSQGQW